MITINQGPLEYWKHTKYSEQDIRDLGASIDTTEMGALIQFNHGETICTVSTRTWERQEGHYPVMSEYFHKVANHPYMLPLKGSIFVWLEDGMWPHQKNLSAKAPVLTFGKHHQDALSFLIPDPAYLGAYAYKKERADLLNLSSTISWDSKKPSIFWRGAASGDYLGLADWKKNSRATLCLKAKSINDPSILDACITKCDHLGLELEEAIIASGITGPTTNFSEFLNYKYVVDVDGYSCAWKSLFLKLISGSVTLKIQSSNLQWYYDQLIPWKHYVPISPDLSDLLDIHAWLKAHDSEAQLISKNAKLFIEQFSYDKSVEEAAILCSEILGCCKDKH